MDTSSEEVHAIQKRYPALSTSECTDGFRAGYTDTQLQLLNDKKKTQIEQRVRGFIPETDPPITPTPVLNIILVGETGAGKSSVGNLILGEERFKVSSKPMPCTTKIEYYERQIGQTKVRVVDTPCCFNMDGTAADIDEVATQILKVGVYLEEGVHLFVLVQNLAHTRSTAERAKFFEFIEGKFSESALAYCVFLYTNALNILNMEDISEKTLDGYLNRSEIFATTGGRRARHPMVKLRQTLNNRFVAVENICPRPLEEEMQRNSLLTYFKSLSLKNYPVTFSHMALDNAKASFQMKIPNRNVSWPVSQYLVSKSRIELKVLLRGNLDGAVDEIMYVHNLEAGNWRGLVKDTLKAKVEVLTNEEYLVPVKKIITLFLRGPNEGCFITMYRRFMERLYSMFH